MIAVTALEAMKELPPKVWMKIGIGVVALIVVLVVVPKILKMNKIILGVIVFVASTIIFFSWVSQRNEPKFLTPVLDHLAPFFSSDVVRKDKEKKMPK
jgi:hypothetical protein